MGQLKAEQEVADAAPFSEAAFYLNYLVQSFLTVLTGLNSRNTNRDILSK